MSVIGDAVRRISSGALEKVVLARDLVAPKIPSTWKVQHIG